MTTSPEASLSPEAELAWQAYEAMGESKQDYFGFLQELDQKYAENESPSIAENLKLEELLKTHDERVRSFNVAMANVEDEDARKALIRKLTHAAKVAGTH